ncbi:MAG: DNA methyltransferase [Verrucomicrobiia bacterium]
MTSLERGFVEFAEFVVKLKGDEKSEAQTFLFHLLEAFSNDANTLPEGSTFEYRVRFPGQRTKFADFVWPGRALIEMKSRGAKLSQHYQQTFDYWINLVPHRPPYVVLCNFDEFWIYDFNLQLNEPVDRVKVSELPERHSALNFLFFQRRRPIFGNNWVEVTRDAANDVALVFNELVHRGELRERAQRFILQAVIAMFSEDIGLLPEDLFTVLVDECIHGADSYDLIGGLFRQMNDSKPARGGRYGGVDYFNGGLFAKVEPIALQPKELGLLFEASKQNWSKVQPIIFGTLFEGSLLKAERHALGAHFTYESDIQKVVRPTIVRPWDERLAEAKTGPELIKLLDELRKFRVLDPACGSGNFLYVAYRALHDIEQRLLLKLFTQQKSTFERIGLASGISPKRFFGLDVNEFAVELAKVTLMLGRRLAHRDAEKFWEEHRDVLPGGDTSALQFEKDLPLDNLDDNILCRDALFTPWPDVEAIIGNPPFLDARKATMIYGAEYTTRLRKAYPDIPGRADLCVHWFHIAHDRLKPGCRAGLVGTNSIRQNYSREGGLDYIVKNGGTITEAVSSQPWSGESAVHVSIVNWIKGEEHRPKKIFTQVGNNTANPWTVEIVNWIPAALTAKCDVTSARHLEANRSPKVCLEGQQPGHTGFVLDAKDFRRLTTDEPRSQEVLYPFLNGDDLISGDYLTKPTWVIDFGESDVTTAQRYKAVYEHLQRTVLPLWTKDAEEEKCKTGKTTGEHQDRLLHWWQLKRRRGELLEGIQKLSRYIACSAVTKRPIFEFISCEVRPSNALKAFLFEDDYSFGILQSGIHWEWFVAKGSTLTERYRYTPDTVFDTFPWPQKPTLPQLQAVVKAARELRQLRRFIMEKNEWSLRELYRTLDTPGDNRLRHAHEVLDAAVRRAYGMNDNEDILAFLLKLNLDLADKESKDKPITPPGLPPCAKSPAEFVSADCVECEAH